MASKRTVTKRKRITVRVSPEDADKIMEQEFTDSRGNKIKTIINIKPHLPKIPTFNGFRFYKDDNEGEQKE